MLPAAMDSPGGLCSSYSCTLSFGTAIRLSRSAWSRGHPGGRDAADVHQRTGDGIIW